MYWGAENWSQYTDLVLENMSGPNPDGDGESLGDKTVNNDDVEAGPAGATESNTRPADDPVAASDVQSSESILPTSTRSTAGSKESTAEDECEALSPDAVQQCSDAGQTAAPSSDGHPSEATDPPSRKAPQARRSRLAKPKPRLVPSSRPPQPRQVQNAKQAETDVAACSEGVDAELRPDIPDPTEGAVVQSRNQICSPKDAGSSLVPDTCPRDASTSNATSQSLPISPDVLSQPEASDPEEPFFILSLTEIPVGSPMEPVGRAPELPVTDEQQSVPGEAPLPRVPASAEETASCPTHPGWMVENPVEPESKDETEIPPKQTRSRVKEPVKPKTTKRKQASETLAAKEAGSIPTQANAAEPSELPGPSLQPGARGRQRKPHGGSGDVEQEDGGAGARTTRTRATRSQTRKPKDLIPVTSETSDAAPAGDAPPGKAAPEGRKARAPRAAGKRATAATAASPPRAAAAPTHRATRERHSAASSPPTHTPNTPNTSLCPAEVSASQKSDSSEEEPTSVSQYFLSDIFTDVEG